MAEQRMANISWKERYSGLFVSVLLFAVLFVKLATTIYPLESFASDFQSIRVMLTPAIVTPPEPEPVIPPPMPEVAATRAEEAEPAEEEAQPAESREATEVGDEAMEMADAALPEPIFLIAEDEPRAIETPPDLEAARERANAMLLAMEQEHDEIRSYLMRERLNVHAQEFEFNSQGLAEGAVRTFDITMVPEDAAEYVFKRYGIRIVRQRLTGTEGGSYLNAAKTRQGVYTNRPERGVFEVFQISPRAQAKMSELEQRAIQERGMNPSRTQVQEVVFSVGKVNDDWDLVIRSFKARDIN